MLEDHADGGTELTKLFITERGGFSVLCKAQLPVFSRDLSEIADGDAAVIRNLEEVQTAYECTFAGTGVADDAVDLAVSDGQGNVVYGMQFFMFQLICFFQMFDLNHVFHSFLLRYRWIGA